MNEFKDISHLSVGETLWVARPTLHDFYGQPSALITEYVVSDPANGVVKLAGFDDQPGYGLYCEAYFLCLADAKRWAALRLVELLADLSRDTSSIITDLLASGEVVVGSSSS